MKQMDAVGGKWAGSFNCSVCRKKRLIAERFSATQLRKLRAGKLCEDELKCKDCVSATETAQRER